MGSTVQQKVEEFHTAAGIPIGTSSFGDEDRMILRGNLIDEEYFELFKALGAEDPVAALDALCDLVYVCIGTAIEFGWSFDAAFNRVHDSNMTKFEGGVSFRPDGKVLKGKGFKPPKLEDLV